MITGAAAWGVRLGDFNMFHVLFGGVAVFATPVAAIAVWTVWMRLRASKHRLPALAILLLCIVQVEIGAAQTLVRMQRFGPGNYRPVPLDILMSLERCRATPRSPTRVDPSRRSRCGMLGSWESARTPLDVLCRFVSRRIYSRNWWAEKHPRMLPARCSCSHPNTRSIQLPPPGRRRTRSRAFLRSNGIGYIYEDGPHPNEMVPSATVVAEVGEFRILQIP